MPLPTIHDQRKAIAFLLCPYLRAISPKKPYRCIVENEAKIREIYEEGMTGRRRKRLFQSKRGFIADAMVLYETNFVMMARLIELRQVLPDESEVYWMGTGEKKFFSSAAVAESGRMFGTHSGGDALVQVDISAIWTEISPLLDHRSSCLDRFPGTEKPLPRDNTPGSAA